MCVLYMTLHFNLLTSHRQNNHTAPFLPVVLLLEFLCSLTVTSLCFDSEGSIQLDCLGGIQDKITVCATDDSYQKARENMAQAEEESRSRSAIVIKPGGRYLGEKMFYVGSCHDGNEMHCKPSSKLALRGRN